MRVVFDTNVFISYLLKPKAESAVTRLIRYAASGDFELVTPSVVRDELVRNVQSKPYLSERISPAELDQFLQTLNVLESVIDVTVSVDLPDIRDSDDVSILASAIDMDAGVLVTGDADLLVLSMLLEKPRILNPAQFVLELDREENFGANQTGNG